MNMLQEEYAAESEWGGAYIVQTGEGAKLA